MRKRHAGPSYRTFRNLAHLRQKHPDDQRDIAQQTAQQSTWARALELPTAISGESLRRSLLSSVKRAFLQIWQQNEASAKHATVRSNNGVGTNALGRVVGFCAHCSGMRNRGLPHRGVDFGGIDYLRPVDWSRMACDHHMRKFDLLVFWRAKRSLAIAGSDLNAISRRKASRGCEIAEEKSMAWVR
jgi:hypothetical protein